MVTFGFGNASERMYPMSSSSNGTFSLCKSKVEGEVVGLRSTGAWITYQLKKKKKTLKEHKKLDVKPSVFLLEIQTF